MNMSRYGIFAASPRSRMCFSAECLARKLVRFNIFISVLLSLSNLIFWMKARGLKRKQNATFLTLDCVTNGRKGFVASYFSLCVHNGKLYVLVFKITLKLLVKRVVWSHVHLANKRRDSIQIFFVSMLLRFWPISTREFLHILKEKTPTPLEIKAQLCISGINLFYFMYISFQVWER